MNNNTGLQWYRDNKETLEFMLIMLSFLFITIRLSKFKKI